MSSCEKMAFAVVNTWRINSLLTSLFWRRATASLGSRHCYPCWPAYHKQHQAKPIFTAFRLVMEVMVANVKAVWNLFRVELVGRSGGFFQGTLVFARDNVCNRVLYLVPGSELRSLVGFCPQGNIGLELLTVREQVGRGFLPGFQFP